MLGRSAGCATVAYRRYSTALPAARQARGIAHVSGQEQRVSVVSGQRLTRDPGLSSSSVLVNRVGPPSVRPRAHERVPAHDKMHNLGNMEKFQPACANEKLCIRHREFHITHFA